VETYGWTSLLLNESNCFLVQKNIIDISKYRMARNFQALKILRFLGINHKPRKFYPWNFALKFF